MKFYCAIFVLVFLIGCASDPSNSKANVYLSEKDNESLEDLIDIDVNNSIELFPIPATNIKSPQLVYDLPLPKQARAYRHGSSVFSGRPQPATAIC